SGEIPQFWLFFVVQQDNYREMIDFVELGTRLGVDRIWFQKVINFGTFDESSFARADVSSSDHAEHHEFLRVLSDPRLRNPIVDFHTLSYLLPASENRLARGLRQNAVLVQPSLVEAG